MKLTDLRHIAKLTSQLESARLDATAIKTLDPVGFRDDPAWIEAIVTQKRIEAELMEIHEHQLALDSRLKASKHRKA
jgi:hypothetical protein